jgi:hypothetical protein
MGCNPCSQINERNRSTINKNDTKIIKGVKYTTLYEKEELNSEIPFINRSCKIFTNYNLDKLEQEITKIDNNSNINNNETKEPKEIKKEEKEEKQSRQEQLYNIANNDNNIQKNNVNNTNSKENINNREEGHQFIIVDDNELVPSQSINGTNVFVINSERNSKISNGKSFKSLKASVKNNIGNNLEGIIRGELGQ